MEILGENVVHMVEKIQKKLNESRVWVSFVVSLAFKPVIIN